MPLWCRALAATFFIQVVSSLAAAAVPLLGPVMVARLDLKPEGIGYISAASSIGICWYLASGSPMMARYGAMRLLQLDLICSALGLVLMASSFWQAAILGAVVFGLGMGPNTPGGSQILMRAAPSSHRNLIFSIKQAGMPLGGSIAGLSIATIAMSLGFSQAVIILAACCLVAAVAVQPLRAELDENREATRTDWLRSFWSPERIRRSMAVVKLHPRLRVLTIIGIALSVTQACVITFSATFIVTKYHKTLVEAGHLVALMLLSSFISRIVLGWIADRIGDGLAILLALSTASGVTLLALAFAGSGSDWMLRFIIIAVGATTMGWTGVLMAELAKYSPAHLISEVTSASSLFGFVGYVVGPLLFALVAKHTGSFEWSFGLVALQVGSVAVFSLLALRYPR